MQRRTAAVDKQDIKAMIWKRGSTLRLISTQAGLDFDTASRSLIEPIPRANKAIADFLAISLHELWPRWYDQNGNRIKQQRHCKNLARPSRCVSANSSHSI